MIALSVFRDLTAMLPFAMSGAEIARVLHANGQKLGFRDVLIVDAVRFSGRIGDALVYASAGLAALEAFDRRAPFVRHPLFLRACETAEPFPLSDAKPQPAQPQDWIAALPPHLRGGDGLVVPVHANGRLAWYVDFAGGGDNVAARTRLVLAAASHAAHARFLELGAAPETVLTSREAECLQLVALGRSDAEIAAALDIRPRTVRFHIYNAKEKLGVATRIQAVARMNREE